MSNQLLKTGVESTPETLCISSTSHTIDNVKHNFGKTTELPAQILAIKIS
jgi:hypothetical protein